MKTQSKDVKLKGEVVETVECPVYETIEELIELDPALLLGLVNRQTATDLANAARAKYREAVPGKGKKYNMAFNLLPTITFSDGSTGLQKLNECATLEDASKRKEALDKLLMSAEVQAEVEKALSERGA